MGTRLTITPPRDYSLARDVCSYGYFLLAPNRWDPVERVFTRVLSLSEGPARVWIAQERKRGAPLAVKFDRAVVRAERPGAVSQIGRMLRLDEDHDHIASFHRVDERWKKSGRGRLFRSPTLFEDVLKTVTSCNVAWPSTMRMNERLCEVVGPGGSFPTAKGLARVRPQTLRARCSVGYRDARIVELARLFAAGRKGGVDQEWMESPATSDDELHTVLLDLPGIGPYAAANIMQLMGRYERLPLDTESVRHGRNILKYKGSDAQVMKNVKSHYEPFGAHAFRSYWFEMWLFYESKRGPSHTWERETTGRTFTAAQF